MKSFNQALREAGTELEADGVPEAELNAWHLLAFAAEIDRAWLMLHGDEAIPEAVFVHYHTLVERRKKRIPLEYLTHRTEFMGLPFTVDGRVLIPRQDTECLVEEALKLCGKARTGSDPGIGVGPDVLDLCTGSGCIAVSLAVLGNCRSVTATDKSVEALAVARENATQNGVREESSDAQNSPENGRATVHFIHSDLWENVEGTFDLITCNPPYIRRDVIPTLMPEVRDYEPVMALDGGEDGLGFYRRILAEIGTFLRENGHLILEIGYDQGEAVAKLMREAGLIDVQVKQDLTGLDRVVMGRNYV